MSTLQQYQAEVVINDSTGESFMSISALARVCGKPRQTISDYITPRFGEGKMAEVLTSTGLKTSRLMSEEAIAASIAKYNPELATKLMQLGVRKLCHEIAGWQAPQQSKTAAELLLENCRLLVENERRISVAEAKVERLEAFAPTADYYTLTGYYKYHKRQWDVPSASAMGRKLRKASEELGFVVKPVHDARYQSINSYHETVLKHVLGF